MEPTDIVNAIDFSKLAGFEQVTCDAGREIDFRDAELGSKRGAKRGGVEAGEPSSGARD